MRQATLVSKGNTRRNMQFRCMVMAVGLLAASQAFAHGGGLNAEGCHNNRKTGDYHCHRAQQAVAPMPSHLLADERGSAQKVRKTSAKTQPRQHLTADSSGPTCYTGPRGGTYTLTSSGNKNYSGC
jgi:myo-inositol-hexaphosphate 3-phosphohydrolase